MAGFFGGKDPFDHPFFTQPYGGLFGERNPFDNPFFSNPFGNQSGNSRERISIEEINPNENDGGHTITKDNVFGKELCVNSQNGNPGGFQSFSFQRVAVGGSDGVYYTSSVGKRTGDDGVFLMEMNEEDKIVGESVHTVSKGIHDKGHSISTRKSASGQVNSLETLHNLNEDELVGFQENWQNNANKAFPGWSNGFNFLENAGSARNLFDDLGNWTGWGGWNPSLLEYFGDGVSRPNRETISQSSSGTSTSRRNIPIE